MLKVLLLGPIQKDAEIQNWGAPSLGIIRITEYIRNNFDEDEVVVDVYDSQIDNFDPFEKWKYKHVDILGISLLHYTFFDTIVFITKFREYHPKTLIVVGGNEAGANYQDIFDKSPTDIAVTAEGEDTFADIIKWKLGRKKLEEIDGIVYRKYAKPITANALWDYWKDVDFSRFRYQEYWKQIESLYEEPDYEKIKYVRLMTVSHCQRGCTFCSLHEARSTACGKFVKPVALTGLQIMELVEKVHKQLPDVRTLYFCSDDVYYPERQNFLDFIELYKRSGYDYRILIQTSTYSLHEEDFPLLNEINCQHITVGFENCSERLRKKFRKPQKTEKMDEIIQWGKRYGIAIYVLIILIPPEATMDDLKTNYETLSRWMDEGVQVSVEPLVFPYRGAPIFEFDHRIHYETFDIDGVKYRDAKWIIPDNPDVERLSMELVKRKDAFMDEYFEKLPHKHRFKGSTAVAIISLLGQLLRETFPDYNYKGV